jgi:hypothetical protein
MWRLQWGTIFLYQPMPGETSDENISGLWEVQRLELDTEIAASSVKMRVLKAGLC